MIERPSLRTVTGLLLATLVFVPGCEPDECNLDFSYTVNGEDDYAYVWRAPSTSCSFVDFIDYEIIYTKGLELFTISELEGFGVGPQEVDIKYVDESGRAWVSNDGSFGPVPSTCVVAIASSEVVDWVVNDHLRVTGVATCGAPLVSVGSDGNLDELQFADIKFTIYTAMLGL